MAETGSCWTCRLRRKKCNRERPMCQTCSALTLRCYYSKDRPEWMDGGMKQDKMAQCIKAQVRQGKERRRERDYVQVLHMGATEKPLTFALPPSAMADEVLAAEEANTAQSASMPGANYESIKISSPRHAENVTWTLNNIPSAHAFASFESFDVDFIMLYVDHVFPFLFPFYAPPMIQGGRAWILDILRNNKTLFFAAMGLSASFFTLVLSNEELSGYEACRRNMRVKVEAYTEAAIKALQKEVQAINQQRSKATLLQQAHAMESITQLLVFEAAMAKTSELTLHLTAAISLVKEIFGPRRLNGSTSISRVMAELERPSWASFALDRPIWNTDQAALRFFLATLLHADVVSCASLKTVPRLLELYPDLLCHDYSSATTGPFLQMQEYMGYENWVLIAIADAAMLDAWKQEGQAKGTLSTEILASRGAQIDRALQLGLRGLDERYTERDKGPNSILHNFYRSTDANQAVKRAAATRIWAYAARIYLVIVTVGWKPSHPTVCESVSKMLDLLQQIDEPAILRSCVWPFCVAGCVADTSQQQDFWDLATASKSLQSFGLLETSLHILKLVWSRRGELSTGWTLADCFAIMGAQVLLQLARL